MTKTEAQAARVAPIKAAINKSPVFVERCLLAIYGRQTSTEQQTASTTDSNGVGFSGADADFGSSLCRQIMVNKYGNPEGKRLSPKQFKYARRMASKYTSQLADHADEVRAKLANTAKPV